MQPYFFPYLGYFSLIKHVDRFILFDPVQSIRHGWIERNRILKQGEGTLYIRVPLINQSRSTLIRDLQIDNTQPWQAKILSQIEPYKKIAPKYWAVRRLLEQVFDTHHDSIVSLNKAALEATCAYLGMPRSFEILSAMQLRMEEPKAADEWALSVCKALGDATEYWNPPGGKSFFDPEKYRSAGIALRFQDYQFEPYDQRRLPFEPALSILDVMMFNAPEIVNRMLDGYELT